MMDDEKLKEYFSKDKIISDKANKVFDNFISEISSNNNEDISKEQDSSVKNNVVNFETAKKKTGWYRFSKLLTVAASLIVIFIGSNAYAHTRGYDNIFFLLKDAVTQKSASGKEEIFSDRDIVISYQSFSITDEIEMQINEIQAENNNAKLYLLVKELANTEEVPLYYKVFNENNEIMFDGQSQKEKDDKTYTEVINLSNFSDDTNSIKLEIYNKNKSLLKTVNIDLGEKTIEARSENQEVKKISQIQLNKFLKEETQKLYTEKELKDREIIILDIYDIFYNDGKYSVKYLFMKPTKFEFENDTVEESSIYLNTIEFNLVGEEYKIVSIEKPEIF